MKKPKYRVGDVVVVTKRVLDGPRTGRYTLVRRMGAHGSWEARHESVNWTIQMLEEEFEHPKVRNAVRRTA